MEPGSGFRIIMFVLYNNVCIIAILRLIWPGQKEGGGHIHVLDIYQKCMFYFFLRKDIWIIRV